MSEKYTATPLRQWDTAKNAGSNTNQLNNTTVSQGVAFNRHQRDYQLFPEEYFTATDCQVYFNDVYMDDITGLSFSLSEVTEPIYGYASNTWDYFARGKRVVHGQFRIAFKEAGYLWTLMDHFGQLNGQQKTHLAYLMNNEIRNVYNGFNGAPHVTFGQVLENIEGLLDRTHLDPGLKYGDTSKKETVVVNYKWNVNPVMKIGDSDSNERHKNQEPDLKGNTTSIKQLQQWLIDNKYGFEERKFNWTPAYGGDKWYKGPSWTANGDKSTNRSKQVSTPVMKYDDYFNKSYTKDKIKKNGDIIPGGGRLGTKWYMLVRYWPDNSAGRLHQPISKGTVGGLARSQYELEFQQAVDRYPGKLNGFWMGDPNNTMRYDGRYGSGPTAGVQLLHKLAEKDDGSGGYYVSDYTKGLLEQGLTKPTGEYDFATKLAVWAFQSNMVKEGKLKQPSPNFYPNGQVDVATRDLMTYTKEVDVVVEGKSLYAPGEAYESRMALYEREVWGHRFVDEAEEVRNLESFFYRGRRDENDKLYTEPLFQKGIDIYINYGPLSHYVKAKFEQYNVGEKLVGGTSLADDVSFNTTVKAIRNVQIHQVEQIIDPNTGHCIEEVYHFIAKDLD